MSHYVNVENAEAVKPRRGIGERSVNSKARHHPLNASSKSGGRCVKWQGEIGQQYLELWVGVRRGMECFASGMADNCTAAP